MLDLVEHAIVVFVFLVLFGIYLRAGTRELMRVVVIATKQIPGVSGLVATALKSEAASFVKTTKLASANHGGDSKVAMVTMPKTENTGHSPEHDKLVKTFQRSFLHENALNPMVYPSLRRMETEVVSMTSAMLHGDTSCAGFLTSGGTESLLMAVKTYRDRARKLAPWIAKPEIVSLWVEFYTHVVRF
ncbi:sphingosine-1-phosphate lyase [Elysia marginata]|uniref:Sphingosine-1-phosphate lyase n=1 Tax=Elysia marginata TaxID=1093978 RepID=A0AAV4FAF4_9GAST|nr:sphingosine-1-phosphate lyase [Elysia marginata]